MAIKSHKDLIVWQKSYDLVKLVYLFSDNLPKSEQFGLVSQMRRCAVSIPSNIAEGHQRHNQREYRQFLGIAQGSAAELETQLLLSAELFELDAQSSLDLLYEVQKMLKSLCKKLELN